MRIAIQPDDYTPSIKPKYSDASSQRWADYLSKAGFSIRWVDVYNTDILDQIQGCHGFMWRWAHFGGMGRIARRLLPVIERNLDLVVYPDQNTCWHYDDKIAQYNIFKSLDIPTPRTWIWFNKNKAKEWVKTADYPLVLKLASGAGSTNVRLIHNCEEANQWISRLFNFSLINLKDEQFAKMKLDKRIDKALRTILIGRDSPPKSAGFNLQTRYVYFQEFLPKNNYDTRVTIIGNRAFAYRRNNRKNDFRASGSGDCSVDPNCIDENFIRLGFNISKKIGSSSCAIDGIYKNGKCVITEISYTYVSWMVYECPGHWELVGNPDNGSLNWIEGHMWPEEAQIEDYIKKLAAKYI